MALLWQCGQHSCEITWIGRHNGRRLCGTVQPARWVASMDDFAPGGESIQTGSKDCQGSPQQLEIISKHNHCHLLLSNTSKSAHHIKNKPHINALLAESCCIILFSCGPWHKVQNQMNGMWQEMLNHPTCAYSPHLLPCNIHVFWSLMAVSKAVHSDGNVQKGVVQWCQQQPKEFFAAGIHQLQHHCDKCLNTCADFC
jgi:hypothetical protein